MTMNLTLCADATQDKEVSLPGIDVAACLRAGVEGTGCPHQTAADAAGYDPSYWTRVLGNERGITLNRLGRLPLEVQRAFVLRWADALGVLPSPGIGQLADLAELIATRRVRVTIESR